MIERVYETTFSSAMVVIELAAGVLTNQGAPAGLASGLGRNALAADAFAGFWDETAGSATGLAGEYRARCRQRGQIATKAGAWTGTLPTNANTHAVVGYVAATNKFTLAAGDFPVGKLTGVETDRGVFHVYFEGEGLRAVGVATP